MNKPASDDWEVIGGNVILVSDGAIVPHASKVRHPRTVVGLNQSGDKLIVLVVDGRKPGIALGMSYDELAAEMLRLGCHNALNLDGGGSSIMAVRESTTNQFKNPERADRWPRAGRSQCAWRFRGSELTAINARRRNVRGADRSRR
ncbi:MAG: phosphodiester glycosidase family protein [Limisphaerales bacterium]